jgi:hypothetical protein
MENLLAGFWGDVYRLKEFNRPPEEDCIQCFIHGNLSMLLLQHIYVAVATLDNIERPT